MCGCCRFDIGLHAVVVAKVFEFVKEKRRIILNTDQALPVAIERGLPSFVADPWHGVADKRRQHFVSAKGEHAAVNRPEHSFEIAAASVRGEHAFGCAGRE